MKSEIFLHTKRFMVLWVIFAFAVPVMAQGAPSSNGNALEEIKINGMLRIRPEFLYNKNFIAGNESTYIGQKVWLSIGKDFTPNSKIFFRIQDARQWGSYAGGQGGLTTANEQESLDLREAWLQVGDMFDGNLALQLGRMRLIYGDQRLVGSLDWTDVGRSFDGLRLKIKPAEGNQLDLWSVLMEDGDTFSPVIDHTIFSGIYDVMKFSDAFLMDLYLLNKANVDDPAAFNLFTAGARFTNRTKKGKSASAFDWTLEGAYQFGQNTGNQVSAYATAVVVGYTVDKLVRFGLEADVGSGDSDTGDSVVGTFDNLIPTNHIYYGQADMVSWKNMTAFNANLTLFPGAPFQARAAYWYASRMTSHDIWYGVSGAASGVDLTGVSDLHLFHEIDLKVDYKPFDFWKLQAGFSWVIRGDAPIAAGASADYYFGYISSVASF